MTEIGPEEMISCDDGGSLALHRLGGDGPPILFVHATGFNARTYGPFVAPLIEQYTVWAPDLRAHGWSTSPTNGDYEWVTLAADIVKVVDHLGIETGDLDCVGHSVGAAVLLLADAQRPGLIRRMYGYEPVMWRPGEVFGPGENPLIAGAAKRREVFANRGEAMERFASRPPFDTSRSDALLSYVTNAFEDLDDGTIRLRCRGVDEAATYDGERTSTNDRITGCLAPVVIGKGADTGFGNLGVPAHESLQNSVLVEHPDLGHFGPLQAPDRLAHDALAALAG
ncbi:MAG: alpha/beta hydrolase [Actinomycetota bacterium]|jgi:pimeloyl-ACP methyl ester carboxylesterase|nr:alpha/beta hydrolase [Actinomycetota bacterium]